MLPPKGTWCSPAPQPLNPWQFPEECTEVGGGRCGIPASSSADNVPTIHPFLFSVPQFPPHVVATENPSACWLPVAIAVVSGNLRVLERRACLEHLAAPTCPRP